MGSSYYPPSGGGGSGVVDGQIFRDADHFALFDTTTRQLLAPDGATTWIDLSGSDLLIPYADFLTIRPISGRFDEANPYWFLIGGGAGTGGANGTDGYDTLNGILYIHNNTISIGNNTGIAGSWDASGNIVAAGLTIGSNTFDSLFNGSGGSVYAAGYLSGSELVNAQTVLDLYTGGNGAAAQNTKAIWNGSTYTDGASLFDGSGGSVHDALSAGETLNNFDTFFFAAGQSSSGSSNIFLQTNGDGNLLDLSNNSVGHLSISGHQFIFGTDGWQPDLDDKIASFDGLTYFNNSGFFGSGDNLTFGMGGGAVSGTDIPLLLANMVQPDTGWATNTATADKTIVLADFTAVAALNALVGGAGTQIQNLTQKFAALETALASQLLPNN